MVHLQYEMSKNILIYEIMYIYLHYGQPIDDIGWPNDQYCVRDTIE